MHGVECSRDGRTHGANKAEEIVRRGVTGSTTGLCAWLAYSTKLPPSRRNRGRTDYMQTSDVSKQAANHTYIQKNTETKKFTHQDMRGKAYEQQWLEALW